MPSRPKILYVTSHYPCGPAYGARIRAFNIGKVLQRLGELSLVLMVSGAIEQESFNLTKRQFKLQAILPLKTLPRTVWSRLKQEFDPRFFGIRGQILTPEDRKSFLDLCRDYDLIWFHTVRIPDTLGVFAWKKSILDVDDLASQIYASQAAVTQSLLRRILDRRMAQLWRRREKLFLERFDIVCVCSELDKALFDNPERTFVVRNGFEIPAKDEKKSTPHINGQRLGFIGSLDYAPTREGIAWFIEKVWPSVKSAIPNARLRLVGKDTDGETSLRGVDIDRLGWVGDVGTEIASWSAMIIPIRQGGGTRIKIAEGFARRCPVISTRFGAYGYSLENGKEAMLADSPNLFSQACIDLIRNTALRKSLTENAYKKYLQYWTWEAQADNIAKAVSHCLSRTEM